MSETIYKVISDNWNCWMTEEAYREARLQMSTGDYHAHKVRGIKVTSNRLEQIKMHSGREFVDITLWDRLDEDENETGETDRYWVFYDGSGDVTFELVGGE